jgi:hypothetical protein
MVTLIHNNVTVILHQWQNAIVFEVDEALIGSDIDDKGRFFLPTCESVKKSV